MAGVDSAETITYFCRCDECRKGLYRGCDWYHMPGTFEDLCEDDWSKLPAAKQSAFVNIRCTSDLGEQADDYALQATTYFGRCDQDGCRKGVYVGDDWYHKPRTRDDRCAQHWQQLPEEKRKEYINISSSGKLAEDRHLYILQDREATFIAERDLIMVAFDVEGTLMPEAWLALQAKTGLEELKRTTAHEPDYDKLMRYRFDVCRKNNIKLSDMRDVVKDLKPLPGALEFLEWLKPLVPRILLLTDTFEEYAMPMFEQLGYPTVFCNQIIMDEEGFMVDHKLRLKDQKRKAVESFQRLNFRIIAVGDSFNDISMLKAAERGILIYPSEKVVKTHPEFPVAKDHNDLRKMIGRILSTNRQIIARELAPAVPLKETQSTRTMWLFVCNVAGTLAPEPWPAVRAKTGIEELSITTGQEPDFNKLMVARANVLRKHGVKLQDVFNMMDQLDVLDGAKEFLEWLKPIVPRTFLLTDGFEEYALPMFDKLGHPMVFCNFLEADKDGYMAKLIQRLKNQKLKTVQELQRLNFKVLAVGSSFNDISMLSAAEKGILYCTSEHVSKKHPEFPAASNFKELKAAILEAIGSGNEPQSKRARTD